MIPLELIYWHSNNYTVTFSSHRIGYPTRSPFLCYEADPSAIFGEFNIKISWLGQFLAYIPHWRNARGISPRHRQRAEPYIDLFRPSYTKSVFNSLINCQVIDCFSTLQCFGTHLLSYTFYTGFSIILGTRGKRLFCCNSQHSCHQNADNAKESNGRNVDSCVEIVNPLF